MTLVSRFLDVFRGGDDAPGAPQTERLTYAIGDIHGRLDRLERMLQQIDADRAGRDADVVFLGDYVDRGPESQSVLRRLKALQQAEGARVTCLLGNHDRMMLDFLEAPSARSRFWLTAGGYETVASFGGQCSNGVDAASLEAMAKDVRRAAGAELLAWLGQLPLWWQSGELIAVHAHTDPKNDMSEQTEAVLLWARPGKPPIPRRDGTWVVHGHTVVEAPKVKRRHISVDTGAWQGGPLSAAVLGDGPVRFLSASWPD